MSTNILISNQFLEPIIALLPPDFNIIRGWEVAENSYVMDNVQGMVTCATDKINLEKLDMFPSLKIISQFGVGIDNIDINEAYKRNIIITNTPDVLTHDTADLAFGLLIALGRDILINHNFAKQGHWSKGNAPLSMSLRNRTIGVVGLGRIGSEVAKRAEAFGMNVLYWGKSKNHSVNYHYVDSLTMLANHVDFLVICCSGSPETKDLIDIKVLKALGSKSFLINISRGYIVNELDLVLALSSGVIAGAGLDVFEDEPNIPAALFEMDNVILQPHVGSATIETRAKMTKLVVDNINLFFKNGTTLTSV